MHDSRPGLALIAAWHGPLPLLLYYHYHYHHYRARTCTNNPPAPNFPFFPVHELSAKVLPF